MPKQRDAVGATYRAARTKPRARLSRDDIVAAAVALLDAEGIDALTFRRLATEIGAGVGSVYWHIDGKDMLLDLAHDHVLGEIGDDTYGSADTDWRERLKAGAMAMWHLLHAHPWAAEQASATVDRGPHLLRFWDRCAAIMFDAGFDPETTFYAVAALYGYVVGVSNQDAKLRRLAQAGVSREQALEESGAFFDALDEAEFPSVKRLGPVLASHDEETQFVTGVDLMLDGLQARRRSA